MLQAYLQCPGVDVADLEQSLDDGSLWFVLYVCERGEHDGGVTRLVLLVYITMLRVQQQAYDVHVTVRDGVVQRCVTLLQTQQLVCYAVTNTATRSRANRRQPSSVFSFVE